jgi:predicted enzyme related to lactoylglutathione lyase
VIRNEIGAVFVPVRNVEAARDWYSRLLSISEGGETLFGHLYVVPMGDGSGLVLDSKDFAEPRNTKPIFHFNTRDVAAAHARCLELGVDALSPITDGVFFTLKDPDGNLLMVADVPPAPRGTQG